MTEYLPPCFRGECSNAIQESESARRLCKGIGDSIIGAGGAGLLEVSYCPMDALKRIGPEQDDPRMAEMRKNLGIVGYWDHGEDIVD